MKMKHLIASVAMLTIVGVGSAYAFPDNKDLPKNHPPVNRAPVEQLSEADMDAWLRLHEKHAQKVEPIRNVLTARRMELKALEHNTKVTPDYLRNLTEEIVNLQTKIAKLDNAFFEESAEKYNLDLRPRQERTERDHDNDHARGNHRNQKNPCPSMQPMMPCPAGSTMQMPCPVMHGHSMQMMPCPAMHGFMLAPHQVPCPEMRMSPHGQKDRHPARQDHEKRGHEKQGHGRVLPKNHPPINMEATSEKCPEVPAEASVEAPVQE